MKKRKTLRREAFVAMCFDERLQHVYHKVVKPVLTSYGFECKRADEIAELGQIVDQIREAIDQATVVVCDLSFENPNVFYELGIAHEQSKPTIMLSQHAANIPFDVQHMRVLPYEDTKTGLLDLRDAFANMVQLLFPAGQAPRAAAQRGSFRVTLDDLNTQRANLFAVESVDRLRYAIKFLGDCQDQQSYRRVEGLALVSENPDVVRDALTAMHRINPEKARPCLLREGLRQQKEFLVRERSVYILGEYEPDEDLLKQICAQAADTSWGVRRAVCEVLGKWGYPEATSCLEQLLGDPEVRVRLAATEARERIEEAKRIGDKPKLQRPQAEKEDETPEQPVRAVDRTEHDDSEGVGGEAVIQ